jgi:hypothetical protein
LTLRPVARVPWRRSAVLRSSLAVGNVAPTDDQSLCRRIPLRARHGCGSDRHPYGQSIAAQRLLLLRRTVSGSAAHRNRGNGQQFHDPVRKRPGRAWRASSSRGTPNAVPMAAPLTRM